MLTKGAIGNLINRYKAVLVKCSLINTFGSLAVASMLVLGGAGVAGAADYTQGDPLPSGDSFTGDTFHDITKTSGKGGVFEKSGLTLDNVAVTDNALDVNGHAYGGAIYATGNLTIGESDFSRNKAITDASGTGKYTACGGAIYTTGVTEITSTGFTENFTRRDHTNSGASNGGAIYSTKDITLRDCTFTYNVAYHHGGAVAAQKILKIYDSDFVSNDAGSLGGAVWLSKATVEITGTDFTDNTSNLHGGAIYQNGGSVEFENVNFTNNKKLTNSGVSGPDSDGGGGAIAVQPNGTTSLSFAGTNVFKENSSVLDGGAIHVGIGNSSSTATMTFEEGSDNTFTGNVSGRTGGAIFNDTDGRMMVNADLAFSGNKDSTGKNDVRNDGLMAINDATLTIDGGISSSTDENGAFRGTITGTGDAVIVFTSHDSKVEARDASGVKAVASREYNDILGGDMETFKRKLESAPNLEFGGMEPGFVAPKVNADGSKEKNPIMDAALKQASITTFALDRILTNDVRKRLGDLRSDDNKTGVWMRWDGGKLKSDGLTNNFNTIQIGGDTKVAKNCRLGVSGSFTHGDGDFAQGNGELEGFSFAAYATWMGENGMFADVVARLGHFCTEVDVEGRTGDMNNRVASLSGEYGWRFNVCDQFFVEPQVELAYTYVSSEDLELGDAGYHFDDMDSLTGRLGFVAGWNLPDKRGNVYARASVVQQFMGDIRIIGAVTGGKPVVQEIDGEDTWLEYGIGANVKLTDSIYVWADVERTEGAEIDEEWRGTVGFRYSF